MSPFLSKVFQRLLSNVSCLFGQDFLLKGGLFNSLPMILFLYPSFLMSRTFWSRLIARFLSILLVLQGPGGPSFWAVGLENPVWVDYETLTTSFLQQAAPTLWEETSSDETLVRLEGLFGEPRAVTPDQARNLLNLNLYGDTIDTGRDTGRDTGSLSSLRASFEITPLEEEDMPFFQAVGYGLWHRLMTGKDGVLPEIFCVLFDVPFKIPSPSLSSKRKVSYDTKSFSYVLRVAPARQKSLGALRQQAEGSLPLTPSLEALFLSSLVALPDQGDQEGMFLVGETLRMRAPSLQADPFSFDASTYKHFLNSRHCLFGMPELTSRPVDSSLLEGLPACPEEVVLQWLTALSDGEQAFQSLLDRGGVSKIDQLTYGIPLVMPSRLPLEMLTRLTHLKTLVKNQTGWTYHTLWEKHLPLHASLYDQLSRRPGQSQTLLSLLGFGFDGKERGIENHLDLTPYCQGTSGPRLVEALSSIKTPLQDALFPHSLETCCQKLMIPSFFSNLSLDEMSSLLPLLTKNPLRKVFLNTHQKTPLLTQKILSDLLLKTSRPESVRLLGDLGADPYVLSSQGKTPLHLHFESASQEGLQALIGIGVPLWCSSDKTVLASCLEGVLSEKHPLSRLRFLTEEAEKRWQPGQPHHLSSELLIRAHRLWKSRGFNDETLPLLQRLSRLHPRNEWTVAWEEIFPAPRVFELTKEALAAKASTMANPIMQNCVLQLLNSDPPDLAMIKTTMEGMGVSFESSSPGVLFETTLMGSRQLLPDVEADLFEDGVLRRQNQHGRRSVASVTRNGWTLFLKNLPEFPGLEYGMHWLHERLLGHGTPPSDLVKINGHPYLVSLGVRGANLEDVLKNQEAFTPDPLALGQQLLLSMLINPEDAKPDNFIVSPFPGDFLKHHFVSIDNDHALIPTLARRQEALGSSRIILKVKSILYCLDHMTQPIPEAVSKSFRKINAYTLLKEWLTELRDVDARYQTLFPNDVAEEFLRKESLLGIPFQPRMISQLYDRFIRLQTCLEKSDRKKTSLTFQEVLGQVDPLLLKRYAPALSLDLSPGARFIKINGDHYDRSQGGLRSTTSSSLLLNSLQIPVEESVIASYRRGGSLTLKGALDELESIRASEDGALLASFPWQRLRSRLALENFLRRVDFSKMPLLKQQAFLRTLTEREDVWQDLTFRKGPPITLDTFSRDLQVGNLRQLVLEDHSTLGDDFLPLLSQESPMLESLKLIKFPSLTCVNSSFSSLKSLLVKECQNLTKVSLGDMPVLQRLSLTECESLSDISLKSPVLKLLDLRQNAVLPESVLDVLLEGHPHLKTLRVTGSPQIRFSEIREADPFFSITGLEGLEESFIKRIVDLLKGKFIRLNLRVHKIGDAGATSLGRALATNTFLTQLFLGRNEIGDAGAASLGQALAINTSLTQLDLERNDIGAEGAKCLGQALATNTSLTWLDLAKNRMGAAGAASLGQALAINTFLTQLSLSWNSIGDSGAASLGQALATNTSLTLLDLRVNQIGAAGATSLGQVFATNTSLTQLNLGGNRIGAAGAASLGQALATNTSLTQLDLGSNEIGDAGAAASLGQVFATNTSLTRLDLGYNRICDVGAASLGQALATNTSLTWLNLGYNRIGAAGAASLSRALATNRFLIWLDLGYNSIGDAGAASLAQALATNRFLIWLDLGRNSIGDAGAASLVQALATNTSLTHLDLGWNNIGDEPLKKLNTLLMRNRKQAGFSKKKDAQSLPSEQPTPLRVLFSGVFQDKSLTLQGKDLTPTLSLEEALTFHRVLGHHHLLQGLRTGLVQEILLPEVRQAFLERRLSPLFYHGLGEPLYQESQRQHPEETFSQRLASFLTQEDFLKAYITHFLGTLSTLDPLRHKASLSYMAGLQGLSYIIWEPVSGSSSRLHPLDHFLCQPPVIHLLQKKKEGEEGYQRLYLKGEEPDWTFPACEEEALPSYPWLESPSVQGDSPLLLSLQDQDALSPGLKSVLSSVRHQTTRLICLPGALSREEATLLPTYLNRLSSLTHVVLGGCGLEDEDLETWVSFLQKTSSLTSLSLPRHRFTEKGLLILQSTLQKVPNLVSLKLRGNPGLTDACQKRFDVLLSHNKGTQALAYYRRQNPSVFMCPSLGEVGARLFCESLEESALTSLVTLALPLTPFRETETQRALGSFLKKAPCLETLCLFGADLGNTGLETLLPALQTHPCLQSLDLRLNNLSGESALSLLNNPHLCSLDLRGNAFSQQEQVQFMEGCRDKTLTSLFLSDPSLQEPLKTLLWSHRPGIGLPVRDTNPSKLAFDRKNKVKGLHLWGQRTRATREIVPGDGNCGYTALGLAREGAAALLLNALDQEEIREMLALEIEEQWSFLPPFWSSLPKVRSLNRRYEDQVQDVQKTLLALKNLWGLSCSEEQLLEEIAQRHHPTKPFSFQEESFIAAFLKQEALEAEKRSLCRDPDLLRTYIKFFIRPSAGDYFNDWGDLNWLSFSPEKYGPYDRYSVIDALARLKKHNLSVWNERGELIHAYRDEAFPFSQTLFLLYVGNSHFDRLVPRS